MRNSNKSNKIQNYWLLRKTVNSFLNYPFIVFINVRRQPTAQVLFKLMRQCGGLSYQGNSTVLKLFFPYSVFPTLSKIMGCNSLFFFFKDVHSLTVFLRVVNTLHYKYAEVQRDTSTFGIIHDKIFYTGIHFLKIFSPMLGIKPLSRGGFEHAIVCIRGPLVTIRAMYVILFLLLSR